jgi:fumarylacetoacetate (FAA) hydrolase
MKLVRYIGLKRPDIWNTNLTDLLIDRLMHSDDHCPCVGIVVGDEVFDARLARRLHVHTLDVDEEFVVGELADSALLELATGDGYELVEKLRELPPNKYAKWRYPLPSVTLLPPVEPGSFRDFYAFERHVVNARKRRGLEMVPEWYEAPVFYFSNIASILGPGVRVRKPSETNELDYELEIAVVIGKEGGDIPVAEADEYIAGFTILNDWSARDLQRQEMKVGLGPAKGKDFATSIGPYLVTPDELEERLLPDTSRGNRYDLTMTAQVNRLEISRGNASEMHWTFAELIAQASRNTVLQPGDLIGSGTVGTGCLTEFPEGTYPWLQPGDTVRLEIEILGVLENSLENREEN